MSTTDTDADTTTERFAFGAMRVEVEDGCKIGCPTATFENERHMIEPMAVYCEYDTYLYERLEDADVELVIDNDFETCGVVPEHVAEEAWCTAIERVRADDKSGHHADEISAAEKIAGHFGWLDE